VGVRDDEKSSARLASRGNSLYMVTHHYSTLGHAHGKRTADSSEGVSRLIGGSRILNSLPKHNETHLQEAGSVEHAYHGDGQRFVIVVLCTDVVVISS